MNFIKNKAKDIAKDWLKGKVENTDFSKLVLDNLSEEVEELIAEKIKEGLLMALEQIDEKMLMELVAEAKNKARKNLENDNEAIKKLVKNASKKLAEKLEKDEEFRKKFNENIRKALLKAIDSF